jgi:hypothetical protein
MPEPPLEVTAAELDAIIDRALERRETRKPEPWDSKTERRAAERRKGTPLKHRKLGGIIPFKE